MNLVTTVLEIVAPVFILAGLGFAWVRLGFEYRVEFVTRLGMTLAVPCLVFVALMETTLPAGAVSGAALAALAAHGGVTVASFVIVRVMRLELRTYLAPLIFGNTGNLGLPLALFAFGAEGLSYAVIVFAVTSFLSFTFGLWLVSGGGSLRRVVQEPLVAATVLGAIFLWQGWQTPRFLTNAIDLIGQMAIPLMLITLGVAVARLSPGRVGRAVLLTVLKFVVCASVAWGTAVLFGLGPVAAAVLIMQMSTPVAVTSYLLAEKYGAQSDAVAGLVVVSTVMSVGTLPLLLAFLV
ncbi:AEC family transporter [Pseudaestuariivita atlantica]|uniref:Transporter n=1 Tax=Pseudaestuariivita atlantica TaxID=1317121 RepID=A0A0L1JP39_9RHOB|nr:AEC family transporter [Pseudaestuariivita atlantica]KNG93491.1 transporter [Pseudaestuariivita atlantica]